MKYNYVYRITNKDNNKHYYGVRSSKVEPKLDLGIKYFSSSTDKEFINEQKANKDKFKYKIIKIFDDRLDANKFESELHKKFEVHKNEKFYNKSISTGCFFAMPDVPKSNEHKINISKALKGKKKSEEHVKNVSLSQKGRIPWNKGLSLSDEKKKEIKDKLKPRTLEHSMNIIESKRRNGTLKHKEETKINFSINRLCEKNSFYGKTHTQETKDKITAANRTVVVCPYCNKRGMQSGMNRWHFKNCKEKDKDGK